AVDAKTKADNAAREANTESGMTAGEAAAVETANQELAAAKAAAKEAINAAPDAKREELNAKVDGLAPATVPTVNDKNPANGVQDDIDAKIQAAVDAKTKADNAAREANTDGVVTAEEAAAVETANQELAAAKAAAKEAINAAPDAKREELNAKVDGLAPATVPEVTPIKPLAFDSESKPTVADGGNKVILNLNGKATSDHPADTFDGNKATLIFGDATSSTEKVHTLTGAGNGRIKVYNPKLDWDMRTSDDGTGTQQDHAPGWGYDEEALKKDANYNSYNTDDYRDRFYKWTGARDAADIILVENVQTDPGNNDTKVQGMIASEAKGSETKQVRFALDTLAGGNDYIKAKGVGGHVKIKTNEGDDVIELGYMNGRKGLGVPFYDGSNQIDMGEGNDKLLVTSNSSDQGVYQLGYDNGSLYYTNAKIDMGEGNNEVSIYHNIIAGAED